MNFNCPKCGKSMVLPTQGTGSNIECAFCGADIRYSGEKVYSGKVIAGFELQELLGVGGMGEVWLAYQQSMDRQVALKILSPYLSKDKSFVDNFLEEVKLAAKLEHPNIVSAFDAGVDDGIYYLAMSYVPGETFAVRVMREKRLPEQEIMKIATSVGQALQYAWGKYHILHRDVNPSNIMLTPEGDIKLMDMGISKNMEDDHGNDDDSLVGTPNYISPEQIRGDTKLDVRSDIYSLGATLYHLATGAVPFNSDDTYEILDRQLKEKLPPVRQMNPEISPACSDLIGKMLLKDRDQRPPSWGSFLQTLDKLTRRSDSGVARGGSGTAVDHTPHKQVVISKEQIRKVHEEHERELARRKKKQAVPMLVFLLALIALAGYVGLQILEKGPSDILLSDEVDDGRKAPERPRERDPIAFAAREWERIRALEHAEPNNYDLLIQNYRSLSETASGTRYAERARERIRRISEQRDFDASALIDDLKEKAESLFNEGDYETSIALLEVYQGHLAEFTRDQRLILADGYRERSERKIEYSQSRARETRALNDFLTSLAPDLAQGNLGEVISKCNSFQQRAVSDALKQTVLELRDKIENIRTIDQVILDILASGEVEEITINHGGGQELVSIYMVDGNVITAQQEKGPGIAHFDFSTRNIPVAEKYRLTEGLVDATTRELFIGIHYFRRNQFDEALPHFKASGVLAKSLDRYVAQYRVDLEDARVERFFVNILQSAGLISSGNAALIWEEISNADIAGNVSFQNAVELIREIEGMIDGDVETSFITRNRNEIMVLLNHLKSITPPSDRRDDAGTVSGTDLISEQRFYEPVLAARSSRGRVLRVNPLGREGAIIPELIGERLDSNQVLHIQSGDYNNRRIDLNRLRGVTIQVDSNVRNCTINLTNCNDIRIQGASVSRITSNNSNFVMVDSEVTTVDMSNSNGLVHNSRIRYLAAGGEITLDHCLIASIEARNDSKLSIRNSILYGSIEARHGGRQQHIPVIRMLRESTVDISIRNSLIYTQGPLAIAYSHRHHVSRPDLGLAEESRSYMSLADLGRIANLTEVDVGDPNFVDYSGGNFNIRFNSPAKRASISRRNDIGPHPSLKPFPF